MEEFRDDPPSEEEDLTARLPDEVLEHVLGLASAYGDLRSARAVSRRWRRCAVRERARRDRAFVRATREMALEWEAPRSSEAVKASPSSSSSKEDPPKPSPPPPPPPPVSLVISKRYSHSACYDDRSLSMYVFGGCTSTSSTFNDLWRLDLSSRTWTRPMSTGTYPSPKACAVMVLHQSSNCLLLFGGWTHPSLYPLHQSWRLFNELHQYDLGLARWTHIVPNSSLKPPAMAGHSATIHRHGSNEVMVVFGGLHKQRNNIGQFSSSNDVWCFNLNTHCWLQCDVPDPRPTPRYGQSQLWLGDTHLLVLGGCGGPNNIFNDVWLLDMSSSTSAAPPSSGGAAAAAAAASAPHWRWFRCEVRNAEAHGASHMWCHPAVRVDNYAVVLGKTRSVIGAPGQGDAASSRNASGSSKTAEGRGGGGLSDSDTAQFNVIPQLRRGINRGYGAIRRQNTSERYQQQQQQRRAQQEQQQRLRRAASESESSDMETSSSAVGEDEDRDAHARGHLDLSVEPVQGTSRDAAAVATALASSQASTSSSGKTFKTSVHLNVNQQQQDTQTAVGSSKGPSTSPSAPAPPPLLPPSGLPRAPPEMARLQAFTTGSPSTYTSSSSLGAVPKKPLLMGQGPGGGPSFRQMETRQRQLEALKRMEERIKSMDGGGGGGTGGDSSRKRREEQRNSGEERPKRDSNSGGLSAGEIVGKASSSSVPSTSSSCTCHRLSTMVLDISQAVSDHVVTWLPVRPGPDLRQAPEETILYTLVRGRSELVLFGGIQKDVSSMTYRSPNNPQSSNSSSGAASDTVSNSVYYLVPPRDSI